MGVMLLDAHLVVYQSGGAIVVADDLCSHRGVPLSMGNGNGQKEPVHITIFVLDLKDGAFASGLCLRKGRIML